MKEYVLTTEEKEKSLKLFEELDGDLSECTKKLFDDPNERAQWADQERTFEQMYNQRYGYRSFEKDSQMLNKSIMSWSKTSEIVMFVPSMSAGN